ncbi:TlpA family protein disulfide reductase [Arenicellales bacterium IMCC55707]|nr:TlpA family protein disulfide reductase [Gammaproteobacteria bacterium]
MRLLWLKKVIILANLLFAVSFPAMAEMLEGFVDFDGQPAALNKIFPKERWVVVMIWSHTCPICAREMSTQVEFHERHREGDIAVLGMSLDGQSDTFEAWAFSEEHSVTFPNVLAGPQSVAKFFYETSGRRLKGTPTFMIFGPKRELKAVQSGPVAPEVIERFIDQLKKND